jgi:hypothetical protein
LSTQHLATCINDSSTILIGIHTGITGAPIEVSIIRAPQIPTCIEDNIYKPFDDDKFVMSHHPVASEEEADDEKFEIKPSSPTPASPLSCIIKYHLIRKGDHPAALVGTNVCSRSGTAPPLNPYNFNPFHRLFGVKFKDSSAKTRIRIISPYEYCQCWNMNNNLIVDFAKTISNIDLLKSALPGNTTLAIIEATLCKLTEIRFEQSSFLDSSAQVAPAATAMSFISGATTLKLPTIESWRAAYESDEETKTIIAMLQNPSTIQNSPRNNPFHLPTAASRQSNDQHRQHPLYP